MSTQAALAAGSGTKTGLTSFIAAHSVALSLTGGALLGVGAYYWFSKRKQKKAEEAEEAAPAAA